MTTSEQEKKWEFEKTAYYIKHKMLLADRYKWGEIFKLMTEGRTDQTEMRQYIWARMQH